MSIGVQLAGGPEKRTVHAAHAMEHIAAMVNANLRAIRKSGAMPTRDKPDELKRVLYGQATSALLGIRSAATPGSWLAHLTSNNRVTVSGSGSRWRISVHLPGGKP